MASTPPPDGAAAPHGLDPSTAKAAVDRQESPTAAAAAETAARPLDGASTAGGSAPETLADSIDLEPGDGSGRDEEPAAVVAVEGIGDGVVEKKQSTEIGVVQHDTIGRDSSPNQEEIFVELDAIDGLSSEMNQNADNGATEAVDTKEKGGDSHASESELVTCQSGLSLGVNQSVDIKASGGGGREAVDMEVKGGDGVASESELLIDQSSLSSWINQSMDTEATGSGGSEATDTEDKGGNGVASESEWMVNVPIVEAQSDEAHLVSGDATYRNDSVTPKDAVSPLEAIQSSQLEEEKTLVSKDGVPDSIHGDYNKGQVGEPEPSKEAEKETDKLEEVPGAEDGVPVSTDGDYKGQVGETEPLKVAEETVKLEDVTYINDSVTPKDGVSPLEVIQSSQLEEEKTPVSKEGLPDTTDGDYKGQVGEPEPSKEAEKETDKLEEEVPVSEDGVPDSTDDDYKGQVGEPELSNEAEKEAVKHETMMLQTSAAENDQHARYYMPLQDDKAAFSVSNLVWGKVKSYPWWPGEIFEPSHASEMALKHQKEGKFLIAYFGDKTFAWNDESRLKPFYTHFSQMEKQSNLDAFTNAVNAALEEVTRRVMVGMTCTCFADDAYAAMKYKKVENAGIQEGTCSAAVDRSLIGISFEPKRLLDYIEALAQYPYGGADSLELVTARAQLKSFYHLKGYPDLPEFLAGTGLMENDSEASPSRRKKSGKDIVNHPVSIPYDSSSGKRKLRGRGSSSSKQKHISEDSRKQRRLSELMEEKDSPNLANDGGSGSKGKTISRSSGKKRKAAFDSGSPDPGKSKKKRLDSLGDLEAKTLTPRSTKVGERISRIASQLTGSPLIIKSNGETKSAGKVSRRSGGGDDTAHALADTSRIKRGDTKAYSSPSEVLSQLCLAARDPMKGYSFQPKIISFFTGFRVLISSKGKKHIETVGRKRGRRKSGNVIQDSYWSDVIFHNSPEEELASSGHKRKGKSQPHGRKKKMKPAGEEPSWTLPSDTVLHAAQDLQIGSENYCTQQEVTEERTMSDSGEKIAEEYTPTALILSFTESDTLPSEADLINVFSRFGSLEEAKTEVLKEANHAKVVFRKRTDAETAYSSSGKCSIFGTVLVTYQLKYLPSTSKVPPDAKQEEEKDASPNEDAGVLSDNTQVDSTQVQAAGN